MLVQPKSRRTKKPSITKALPVKHGGYSGSNTNRHQGVLSLLGPQLMASALRRLAAAFYCWPHLQFVRSLSPLRFGNGYRSFVSSVSSEDGAPTGHPDFGQWKNGGGFFHKSACIDPTVFIEFGAVVHSKSVVGEHVCIGSGAVIGPSVTVGQSTKIGYNVALSNCSIGDSCIIHNGVCIGQDGFGFMVDEHGNMLKKPQVSDAFINRSILLYVFLVFFFLILKMLNARIGNHVEIGANTCVDRGSWRDTVVGDHSKIDNLVQIGHNVVIGKNCILCGLVGIAGSVTIGDYVTMGGRVAVRDHVSIVSKVRLAGMSCVTKDITEPGDYGGFPAVPAHQWRRQVTNYSRTSKQRNPGNH
ncbi:hypothetical protein DVH24_011682 [Malus domestica]|uniref:UDP-3-O-[3-hydroxymyristoyl] glucosamine N-acyltransferase non-repeat region domain-containing protein n=1 Tax=Malus domestica TaxID=3750 RepID=A0A498JWM4_MALDO|nr:hypothetical protein DVH24_011682 [Malus domestica]